MDKCGTVNAQHGHSIILSLQKADGSCCSAWACCGLTKELLQNPMAMVALYANKRVAAKPYGDGDLTVICATNRVENEQDWKGVQFVSTAAVLIICKLLT